MEKCLANLFVVHDVPGEAADERHFLRAHCLDERLRVVPELEHVVGDAAAPDGMHGLALRVVEHLAVEGEVAHVAYAARVAVFLELLCEQVELVYDAILQVVADGETGMLDASLVGMVDADEVLNPGIEELARLDFVAARELLEGLRVRERVGDLAVLVHARGSVAVELAEGDFPSLFVEEDVEAREGEHGVIAARHQDELG